MPKPFYQHPSFEGLIGVSRQDITPPVGIYFRNWGAARLDAAEGIHRPMTLTALTFQRSKDDVPLVLVAVDLGWWRTKEDEWFVRSAILEAMRIDPARLMMNLSHTHAGPSTCREDRDFPGGDKIEAYVEKVRDRAISAAKEALNSAAPSVLAFGSGVCGLARNRDLPDEARGRVVCGFNPDGPSEQTVSVGRVSDSRGAIRATVVHYACHPTTLAWDNRLVSPDYVGAMRELVESQTSGAPCLFLQGPSGDLGPRDQYVGDSQVADRNGRQLGYAALSVLEQLPPHRKRLAYGDVRESGAPLATWNYASYDPPGELDAQLLRLELELREIPGVEDIDRQLDVKEQRVIAERQLRRRRLRNVVGDGPTTSWPVWVWRIGDIFFAGQANEPYSSIAGELRRRLPDKLVLVMNLVNGSCGYMPPAELYDKQIYQVWQTPFARGSLERMTDAIEETVKRIG